MIQCDIFLHRWKAPYCMTNVGENTRFLRLEVINLACFPAQNSWAAAALTVIPEVHEVGDCTQESRRHLG